MSEYQYFEFQTVDRPLIAREMKALRKHSSRATITPSSFVNEYHFGDFKGDPIKWMERYFDGYFHFANWGTRDLIFRFPLSTLDTSLVQQYCPGEVAECWTSNTHIFVRYFIEEFEGEEWWKDEDGTLAVFLELRSDILCCVDYRMFYLGWLLALQEGAVGDDAMEPPVPHGLKSLSQPLKQFAKLFGLNSKLIKKAARNSTKEILSICEDDIGPCVAGLTNGQQYSWLCCLALHNDKNLGASFRREILSDAGIDVFCDGTPRSAGEICIG